MDVVSGIFWLVAFILATPIFVMYFLFYTMGHGIPILIVGALYGFLLRSFYSKHTALSICMTTAAMFCLLYSVGWWLYLKWEVMNGIPCKACPPGFPFIIGIVSSLLGIMAAIVGIFFREIIGGQSRGRQ